MASNNKGLNILVLDGGSVPQGLSEILITKDLMGEVEEAGNLEEDARPSQYFDAISGAGVGGVIAILFGRFGLSVSEAMEAYLVLAEKVFAFPLTNGTYDEVKLRETVQDLCEKHLGDRNALLLANTTSNKTKTCVFSTNAINKTKPRIFRSYAARRQAEPDVTIWEAIHATLATPAMLPPISIRTEEFVGCSHEHQNPTLLALKEAQRAFGGANSVGAVVSIGAGVGNIYSLQSERRRLSDDMEKFLEQLSQSSHVVHQEALQRFEDADVYYRFNVNGIHDFDLSSWTDDVTSTVLTFTKAYLANPSLAKRMTACAKNVYDRQKKMELLDLNQASPAAVLPKPMPSVTRQFIQRPSLKQFMEGSLFPQDPGLNQLLCILHGPGGSGKTQAALEFIRCYEDRFWRIFYIDASSEAQIKSDLETAIRSLGRKYKDNTWEDALQVLAYDRRPWLLFFDNADNPQVPLRKYFPNTSHGRVLVTTRNRRGEGWAIDSAIHVEKMTEEEALSLLYAKANLSTVSDEVPLKIVRELGCFALAVAQAGGYIRHRRSMETYLEHLKVEVWRRGLMMKNEVQMDTDYPLSVYASWDLSFNLLSEREKGFLRLCAFLHPSSIPRSIFIADLANGYLSYRSILPVPAPDDHENLGRGILNIVENSYTLDEIADKLDQCSLMSSTEAVGGEVYFNLHSLIHKWCRDCMDDAEKGRYELLACRLLSSAIPEGDLSTIHKKMRDLLPHIDCMSPQIKLRDLGDCSAIECVFKQCGRHNQRLPLVQHIISSFEAQLGPDHPAILGAMGNLANTYRNLGRFADAMELEKKVLEQARLAYGPNDPVTVMAMANLAISYSNLGRFAHAMELEEEVLKQRRSTFGPDHPDTVSAMANLAANYRYLGRFTDAMELEKGVLIQRRSAFGPDHPDTVLAIANFASSYWDLRRYTDAVDFGKQEQQRSIFGVDHPSTVLAIANLAVIDRDVGRFSDALELGEHALEGRKAISVPDYPDTLPAIANLAGTYSDLGRFADAMKLEEEVLKRQTLVSGPDHPNTVLAMGNLSYTYRKLGRYTHAVDFGELALEKKRSAFGNSHPQTVLAAANLARCYRDLGRFADVMDLEKQLSG